MLLLLHLIGAVCNGSGREGRRLIRTMVKVYGHELLFLVKEQLFAVSFIQFVQGIRCRLKA
jgi:hypothetical protein